MTRANPGSEEAKLRDQLCATGAALHRSGLSPSTSGNLSVRLHDGYLLTPTGCSLDELTPDRLSKLDGEGRHLSGDRPTKEVPLHLGMYRARRGAGAVVHLHSTHATAVSCMAGLDPADCLPPLTAYYVMRVGRLGLIGYHRPGDSGLGTAVERTAATYHALLLANHGPIVAAANLVDAAGVAEEVEETAKLFLLLRGTAMSPLGGSEPRWNPEGTSVRSASNLDGSANMNHTVPTKRPANTGDEAAVPRDASATDAALEHIRSRIIDLTLPPGSRVDEALLLREFKLGRTPAREAINHLVAEKLIIKPGRGGTFVRSLDLKEAGDVVMAHQLSENVVGQLCRLDDERLAGDLAEIQSAYAIAVDQRSYLRITALNEQFHLRLNRSIGNPFIFDFAQSTHRHLRRLLVYLYTLEAEEPNTHTERFADNVEEHDRIIAAVRDKDRDRLVRLLHVHASTTQRRLVHIMQSRAVEPFPVHLEPLPSSLDAPDTSGAEGIAKQVGRP